MSKYQIPGISGAGGGTTWYVGAGAPSTLHNDGDFYLNSTNGDVYEQVSGSWGSPVANIKGATGAAGSNGTNGTNGANALNLVSLQTADYTILSTDIGTLFVLTSGSHTFTLPGTVPSNGWHVYFANTGSGTLTIARNGHNIDGAAANLTIAQFQGGLIATDGTNYYTDGQPASGGGSSTLAGLTDVSITSPANNDVLTYVTSASKWENKPASGGSIVAGQNVIVAARRTATDSNYNNTSMVQKISQSQLLCFANTWKLSLYLASGASYVATACVILRTAVESLTVIDRTVITFGGSGAPTLTGGIKYSDSIALSMDSSHDYYFVIHFSTTSGNIYTGGTSFSFGMADLQPQINCGYASGDHTSDTTIPTCTPEVLLYTVVALS